MKLFKFLFATLITAVLISCNNEQSLQKYYVDNQEDTDFLALDVPTSMFTNSESLETEERETLKSIKKINVLALKKEENPVKFEEERMLPRVKWITKSDKTLCIYNYYRYR